MQQLPAELPAELPHSVQAEDLAQARRALEAVQQLERARLGLAEDLDLKAVLEEHNNHNNK